MTSSPNAVQDEEPNSPHQHPTLSIAKTRSTDLLSPDHITTDGAGGLSDEAYDTLTRSPILSPTNPDTGLRRIRQQPPTPRNLSPAPSRKSSLNAATALGPTSPALPSTEDLTRFPSESLHSFSFACHPAPGDRQNVLKRSIEFMRDKLGWASSSPRIASAQARLAGDEELAAMIELMQKAQMVSPESEVGSRNGLGIKTTGLGTDQGPLTGPAHPSNENVFENSFLAQSPSSSIGAGGTSPNPAPVSTTEEPEAMSSPVLYEQNAKSTRPEPERMDSDRKVPMNDGTAPDSSSTPPERPQRASLKRTYTDVAGYSLQHRLTEALAQPYSTGPTNQTSSSASAFSPTNAPSFRAPPPQRSGTTITERAPMHGRRNDQAQSQAIFTTDAKAPWTITAANDLACLVFGVTRAEVRKLGIMEVISESRREWLEDKLSDPMVGSTSQQKQQVSERSGAAKTSSGMATIIGGGITAKLLSKPPSRQAPKSAAQQRRSKTEHGTPGSKDAVVNPHHANNKSRGVLLCGDVVPIRKMNGSTGSASLWVNEKGGGLIWVLEEIAEDVAYLSIDEIGSVLRGKGDVLSIWGMERVRNGMDVTRLIPAFPKIKGTNTGAVDYDAVARLKCFTARTSNSISIPISIEQISGQQGEFRVSSFPHIAGILVLNPATMKVRSANSVFSSALFGYATPDGLPISDLIPNFNDMLRVMIDEDNIELEDGIVIPEHSFRRSRALLALRDKSGDSDAASAAQVFLRPSGLPARHRDGAEIMVDVQMRVLLSDRGPLAEMSEDDEDRREIVYALWITYSRQLHAVNHGIGPVTPSLSRPGTPPQQPRPGTSGHHVDSVVPSPRVMSMKADDDDLRANLLTQQLEEAKAVQDVSSPSDAEPYEHPGPDLIATGVQVIKKKRIDDFSILEEMGAGAYGQVKLARYKKATAKKMVVKYVTKRRILVDTWHRDRRLGTVPLEIHVLDYLRRDGLTHPNIVEMADFFEDDVNYYIEMLPHGLPGMDLFDYIELRVEMAEVEIRKIFIQVADAVRHLQLVAKVVHRDIKDENVVLDGEGRVKVVDFGSAAYIKSGPFDVFVGTIDYASPEVLRGHPYRGKEQDVWALGILLYTIVYKENPFYSIDEIMDHDLRVPWVMSETCLDLIRKMLDRDVERRIPIQAVVDHPWCLEKDDEDEGEAVAK